MSARDRILNRVDEATRETKDAIAKARAEARAQGKPFDLKKFHADRAEAESAKRNLRHPVSKKVDKYGKPYTDKQIADVRGSQAKGRRGKREVSVVDKTIAQRGKKPHGNTIYDPVSGARFEKYTPEEAAEEKKRIIKKREAQQAKGPSKPMNLPDHNESDYTDDEVIKLIMTESYLSLFGFLSKAGN